VLQHPATPTMMQKTVPLIAHRGWSSRFPENSLASIAAAIGAGADEIEIDIRVSEDGVPFLCHDRTVDRVSRESGDCGSISMKRLKYADIQFDAHMILPRQGFPTLAEALTLFGEHCIFNLHIKEEFNLEPILDFLLQSDQLANQNHYIAADADVLERASNRGISLSMCLVSNPVEPVNAFIRKAKQLSCDRVQFFHGNCTPDNIAEAQSRNLTTNYYYCDDLVCMDEMVSWGIDAILTNDIGQMLAGVYARNPNHSRGKTN